MSAPAYESYKDSGVEWLGQVPSHWEITRVKDVCTIQNGYPFDSKLFDPSSGHPLVRIRDIGADNAEVRYAGEPPEAYFITSAEVLVGMDGDFNVGRWNGQEEGLLNQRVCAIRTTNPPLNKFLEFALPAPLQRINDLTYSTTVKHLSSYQVASIKLALPPGDELEKVVRFVSNETGKIDALIEAQTRLIELLKEKRQAVISHAVTKGLNPDAPMKDSGIEWLGQVPAHWEVRPLKAIVTLRSGGTPSKDRLEYWGGDVPWASAKDLKVETLNGTIDYLTDKAVSSGVASLLPVGCVVVLVRGMMLARTFPVCEVGTPLAINQDLKALLPREGLNGSYLAWYLRGTEAETLNRLDEAGHGTKALRMDAWLSLPVALPPEPEQLQICSGLHHELGKLAELSTRASDTISLLTERRAALISAAVTGKIDVRGLVNVESETA